eukprot:993040-Rhodomonas_salina.3
MPSTGITCVLPPGRALSARHVVGGRDPALSYAPTMRCPGLIYAIRWFGDHESVPFHCRGCSGRCNTAVILLTPLGMSGTDASYVLLISAYARRMACAVLT